MGNLILKYGDQNKDVELLTNILFAKNYIDIKTDFFDAKVLEAIKNFQIMHLDSAGRPLKVDGIVGPLTWWALKNNIEDNMSNETLTKNSIESIYALEIALNEIKNNAREIGSNNSGIFVEKYLNNIVNTPANWCAAFISWCFKDACDRYNLNMPFNYSLSARDILNQFIEKDWIYDCTEYLPLPGDLIFWWRNNINSWSGHIGFVYSVTGGVLTTIEGNKGAYPAHVKTFNYTLDNIEKLLGFGRVNFL